MKPSTGTALCTVATHHWVHPDIQIPHFQGGEKCKQTAEFILS